MRSPRFFSPWKLITKEIQVPHFGASFWLKPPTSFFNMLNLKLKVFGSRDDFPFQRGDLQVLCWFWGVGLLLEIQHGPTINPPTLPHQPPPLSFNAALCPTDTKNRYLETVFPFHWALKFRGEKDLFLLEFSECSLC